MVKSGLALDDSAEPEMIYDITLRYADTGEMEVFQICLDTVAKAEKYGRDLATDMSNTSATEFVSVSPQVDSPVITPRFVFGLPGQMLRLDIGLTKALLFINNGELGISMPDWGYDESKIISDGRLKVYQKVEVIHDCRRSSSLYVINFDAENIGWYIGAGREEEDTQESLVTNLAKTRELVSYLMSLCTDPYKPPDPREYGLDDPVPRMYDWLAGYSRSFRRRNGMLR